MNRTASYGHDVNGLVGGTPPINDNASVASAGASSIGTSSYMAGGPKPSPLIMPTPTLARTNSLSANYRSSPMSLQSPSPPLAGGHYAFESMVIEENVRSLLYQVSTYNILPLVNCLTNSFYIRLWNPLIVMLCIDF